MSDAPPRKRGLPHRVKMRHDTHFVEGLTHRHGEPVGKLVSIETLQTDPGQPRSSLGDLADLEKSIRQHGVLEPILVRPIATLAASQSDSDVGEGDESLNDQVEFGARQSFQPSGAEQPRKLFQIISGERRYRAARQAGLTEVPVIEMDVSDREALEIALVENLQRKDLTPFEEADGYRALGKTFNYTHEQIATAVGQSRTAVTESLALTQMPPRARDIALALGVSSKSTLLQVLRLGSESEMREMLEEVAEQGLTRDDLRRRVAARRQASPGTGRRKPYTFRFKSPDKTYNLALSFRRSTVERQDLITALEEILAGLRLDPPD